MGNLQIPENFNMKDLFLDVSLRTCFNEKELDFTGKKTFSTTFYRDNIGFGITDISIEINTSLQPVIEITFKDLYGNTLFGTQRGNDDFIDYSVLFNWPPPKFVFSFKGYLGRKVTWMLNLKTSNISYIPSDGSYEVNCTFVPNQWGFMADLPALYLLACKRLRYEAYGNKQFEKVTNTCTFGTDSVFSLVRVGKRVETKTQEETKNFELLLKQMGSIKFGLTSAVCGAEVIKIDEPIIGTVNGIEIKGFTNLMVSSPSKTIDELKIEAKNSANLKKIDAYLQANIKRAEIGNPSNKDCNTKIYPDVTYDAVEASGEISGIDATKQKEEKGKVFGIVDENIRLINDEIKRRVFSSTKSQISKLTIGEVFRQIARDSGFILGSILQAGFKGYEDNINKRDTPQGKRELIGKCFPLFISDKGEEIPAMTPEDTKKYGNGPSTDYGVEKYEMAFVKKFIEAIGDGIAEHLISDEITDSGEDIIKYRINNLEGIRPNPYKSYYSNIAENILIRSGIIAYITRSSDPAQPGDYPNDFGTDRDRDVNSIVTLANLDMENLTKDILGQLSYDDKESLKRFCTFFDRFISDTTEDTDIGEYMKYVVDEEANLVGKIQFDVIAADYTEQVSEGIRNAKVNVGEQSPSNKTFWLNTNEDKKENKFSYITIIDLIKELVPPTKGANSGTTSTPLYYSDIQNSSFYTPADDEPAFYNASFIDPLNLTATMVYNNGLYWCLPKPNKNKYVFVLFENAQDAAKTKTINVQDATTSDDYEGEADPVGYIPIEQWNKANTDEADELEVSEIIRDAINPRIEEGNCINYTTCKKFYDDTDKYLQTRKIQNDENNSSGGVPAKNLTFAAYTHITHSDNASVPSTPLVFGPFIRPTTKWDYRPRNQRAAIKTMCKAVLKKLDEIETEKSQIMASVFGKANEAKESLYKQMHTIFHQWQTVASTIAGKKMCEQYRVGDANEDLGKVMEREFGMCENHKERGDGKTWLKELAEPNSNTLFVYDYPLAPVTGKEINVRQSIISIQPLYQPDGSTTVLNLIQQICTKNNFVFVPFPGDANSDNIRELYKPYPIYKGDNELMNYFHVIYTPTPETRSKLSNDSDEFITDYMSAENFQNDAISIAFGAVNNQIIKSVNVGTDSTKPTAESILNLQRLVDKENSDHNVAMDCSMLPVYEGRSYKAKIDILGNSQVYPMQYFYLQRMPMFGGLYQIMKVNHSITPNNMSTSMEGIRMRFDVNTKSYGGIPPITLDDLKALEGVAAPRQEVIRTSEGSTAGDTDTRGERTAGGGNGIAVIGEGDISQEFIDFIKSYEIRTLADMDNFIYSITKGNYSTFAQFFNSTQALVGAFNNNVILNDVGNIGANNLVMFDYISNLSTRSNGALNVLEILIMWGTSLSESKGISSISEGGSLNYFFGTNGGKKMSYNKDPNLTVNQCLQNFYFKKRFNGGAFVNRNLFTNIESWCGGQSAIPTKYATKANGNIVYNCDFCKFRGRGYIQLTWRSAYKNLLDVMKTSGIARVNGIVNSWKIIAGTYDSEALLSTSSTDEWDKLFSYPEVGNMAYRISLKAHSATHEVDRNSVIINLNNDLSLIKTKTISIGITPSWSSYKYGYNNYLRVAQICNTLMELNKI